MSRLRVRPVGAHALLVELDGDDPAAAARALWAEALRRREAGELACLDLVPGARTLLLDGLDDVASVRAQLPRWQPEESQEQEPRTVELPVTYDGPDLDDVAEITGLEVDEVVRRHREADYVVAFCGFAPGFAYLTGLPEELHVPRREDPRTKVPAGSVGLAGEFTGVYPGVSPGGWQLVATTSATLWDVTADPPALLTPGTVVRLVDA